MFFGREKQLGELEGLLRKRVASLVTCRGRRRIGKSSLIAHFAARTKCRFIKIEGKKPEVGYSNETELEAFAEQLSAQTGAESTVPSNWLNAFIRLGDKISDQERTVVLLDEISWMGFYDKTFAGTLKIAWDNHWKRHDRLIVVLCGSVSSWIRDNFVENAAFMGRRSLDLVVGELPLCDCVRFWGRAAGRKDAREIIDVLSVTGGVPRYLEEVDPSLDASENIRRMAFRQHSPLRDDFDEMFGDVITRLPALSGRVLRCLVDGAHTVTEISALLKMEKSGSVSGVLDCLGEAGLVCRDGGRNPETGAEAREARYRLRDNYARFYLKFVEPFREAIDAGSYEFVSLESLPGWETVMGLQFENLVLNNYRSVIREMGMDGSLILSAGPYRRRPTDGRRGCQVDLLVQTKRALCLVEIKRRRDISRDIASEVDDKVTAIARPPGVSVKTALVYEGRLQPGVEADGYFDFIIPFERLLAR